MTEDLVFMMGKFEARIPCDRQYAENHLWLQRSAVGFRVGFTSYSVRLLQDVYFLEWSIEPSTTVNKKQEIGEIESSKALSTLYAPFDGRIIGLNEALLDDPSAINTDNYGKGWLFEFESTAELFEPADYLKILEGGWDETQRILKGQLH